MVMYPDHATAAKSRTTQPVDTGSMRVVAYGPHPSLRARSPTLDLSETHPRGHDVRPSVTEGFATFSTIALRLHEGAPIKDMQLWKIDSTTRKNTAELWHAGCCGKMRS